MKVRVVSIAFLLASVIAALPGVLRMEVEDDISASLLSREAPEVAVYHRYLEAFPPDYGAIVMAQGDLCNEPARKHLAALAQDLEGVDHVRQVLALPTADYVTGDGATVTVEDFYETGSGSEASLCALALDYKPYRDLLITDDGRAQAFYITAKRNVDAIEFSDAVERTLDMHRPRFRNIGVELTQSGGMYISRELSHLTARSVYLLGVAAVIMMLVTWLLTRSFHAGLLTFIVGLGTIYFTFAFMGYAGIRRTPLTGLVVNMLIPLGAAYVIHAVEYLRHPGAATNRPVPPHAIKPFMFATLTTMIGFGSTSLSNVEDIQRLGQVGACGIFVCMLLTFFVVFPFLPRHGPRIQMEHDTLPRPLTAPFTRSRRFAVVAALGLVALSALGVNRLNVNYASANYLVDSNPAKVDFERVGEHFGRYNLPMMVSAGEPRGALDPELWRAVHGFVKKMERKFPGLKAAWMYDQLAVMAQAFTADEPEPLTFPDSPELIAQFLLFFDQQDTERYIDWDRQRLSVVFLVPFSNSSSYRELKAHVREFARNHEVNAALTGRVPGLFEVGDQIARENLGSLAIGLAAVFAVFVLLLRNVVTAAIAVFVNGLAVLGCLAFMGLLNIDLDIGSSVVAAVALGLVIDDTGHMLVRYREQRRAGYAPPDAARAMIAELWRAVLATTLVICVGFSVMNFAEMIPFRTFSRLLSATMIYALFADLILLPALLITFDRPPKPDPSTAGVSR